jgi:CRISPR-associated endonuclease Cas2
MKIHDREFSLFYKIFFMSLIGLILEALTGSTEPIPHPFEMPYKFVGRFRKWEMRNYRSTLQQMKKRGLIKITKKNGQKFIQCTKNGQLELLIKKAAVLKTEKWDKNWRLIIFDIPETSREKRDELRWLLKKNHFIKLQSSVFISPYSLNREAIAYLKQTGLINYIRILKVSEIDDDKYLIKKFGLG